MTDIAKQIKKDLFSANRRIARLEALLKGVMCDYQCTASFAGINDLKTDYIELNDRYEKLLKEKW